MKVSLRTEYACRVLAQLGKGFGREELAHIDSLAEAESIPANYLVQILNDLKNGGLIQSRRGKSGGYSLTRAPESISLFEVLKAMEGELLETASEVRGESGERVQEIWEHLAGELESLAREISVKDFMPGEGSEMYYI